MRVKKPYIIITFGTTTAAMATEKRCAEQGIPGRLIPLPMEIAAGCGLAWRIAREDYERCADALNHLSIPFEHIVALEL